MPTCANCGEDNPERFRFCGVCGNPLVAEELAPTEEERKVVSVLFVDLVGFTARSDQADPEDVRATLRPYHAMLKREIERYGGTVEKFIGDAVMAVFGAPVAHEDDAERAVRAALRIAEAVPELNETNAALELQIRGAVNTGEAVVTLGARPERGEGIVTGDVVNTASRLQNVAPVGGVVVGEMTYRATGTAIEYAELDPVQVKGKAEPIPIWQALGARSRFTVEVETSPTPFIGREDDLALLQQTFSRTLRESSAQLVTVTGEPGVGKSRLIGEFSSWIDDRPEIISWRHGRCLPYGEGITFWALGEIVKAQAGILESDAPDEASAKLSLAVETVVEEPAERDWVKARLAPLVGTTGDLGTAAGRTESFKAWTTFLEALASARPLILVVEDLHWADDAMLEFVEYVVEWATAVPLLVICTARPELYERRQDWGGGKRNSTTISLSPLTDTDTAALLEALLAETRLPEQVQTALLERAGGNPLYAEEFVRMIADRGILERRGGAVVLDQDAEFELPDSVQALIAARLDTLPAERKSLLQDAAVVGKVFWSGAVAAMSGVQEDDARTRLHELARKELVRPVRSSSVRDQEEYSFWHVLVRDVAYSQIPRAARVTKHRAAAAWIEELAGERIEDHAELLAHHYTEALRLSRAVGGDGELAELEAAAARTLVMAGDRALRLDVGTAEAYYQRALELVPADHQGRSRILAKVGEAAFLAARYPEAEAATREAIEGFRTQGDVLGSGQALARLGGILWYRGDTSGSHAAGKEAIEMLEAEAPAREHAEAYLSLGSRLLLGGLVREGLELVDRGLELSQQLGFDDLSMYALQNRGFGRCDLGDLGGLEDLRESLRLGLELGLGNETGVAYNNLGSELWFIEGPAPALETQRAAIEFSERRGLTRQVMWTTTETLWTLYDLGRWDELLPVADRLVEWDRAGGGSQIGAIALSYEAHVLVLRGEVSAATALVHGFLPRSREIADPQVLIPSLVIAALIEHAGGRVSSAADLLGELRDTLEGSAGPYSAFGLPDALRLCLATGETALAKELVEGRDEIQTRGRNAVSTARAVLAEATDDRRGAATAYRDAALAWKEYGHVPEQGHALLGEGRCLLAMGRADAAREPLTRAREIFADLRAQPLLDEIDPLLVAAAVGG